MMTAPAKATITTAASAPEDNRLRVIVPKKGRLCAAFAAAMEKGGMRLEKQNARHDFGMLRDEQNMLQDVEALTMRGTDALRTMAAGAADMAVVGLDMLREFNAQQAALRGARVERLGLAPCALYIAAREEAALYGPADLAGARIATSFPGVLAGWLEDNNVQGVQIVPCDGGVEDMIRLGLADAICDLVETGGTLAANGLEKRIKVLDSEAVLVIAPRPGRAQAAQDAAAALCGAAQRMSLVCA